MQMSSIRQVVQKSTKAGHRFQSRRQQMMRKTVRHSCPSLNNMFESTTLLPQTRTVAHTVTMVIRHIANLTKARLLAVKFGMLRRYKEGTSLDSSQTSQVQRRERPAVQADQGGLDSLQGAHGFSMPLCQSHLLEPCMFSQLSQKLEGNPLKVMLQTFMITEE